MVKQTGCAAAISSSGFVPFSLSKRVFERVRCGGQGIGIARQLAWACAAGAAPERLGFADHVGSPLRWRRTGRERQCIYCGTKPLPLARSRRGDAGARPLWTFRCAADTGKCGALYTGFPRPRDPESFAAARSAETSPAIPGRADALDQPTARISLQMPPALANHFRRAPPALAGRHVEPRVAAFALRHWPHVGWRESSRSMSTVALQNAHWPRPMTSFLVIPRTKLSRLSN